MSKAIVTEYYNHLSNKNLDGLKGLFNDSIELQSPTLTTDGVTAVGNGFTELFNSVTTIQVVSATMYEDGNTVVSETNFQIDDVSTKTADIFTVIDGKITAIHSYTV
jgi:ketosteroid isomerase-like protein